MKPLRPLTAPYPAALPPRKVCTLLDDGRFERLKAFAARNRITSQEALIKGLDLLLAEG